MTPQVTAFQFYVDTKSLNGDGSQFNPLRTASVLSSRQAFVYEATGAEGADFVVTLPVAQPDANYVASVEPMGLAAFLLFDCPQGDLTATDVRVLASGALTAGDKLGIVITPRTA